MIPCKRSNGTTRAYFETMEEAEVFAADPRNPAYTDDIAHFCLDCGYFHLSRPEWLKAKPQPPVIVN